jgi:hypothetical protein
MRVQEEINISYSILRRESLCNCRNLQHNRNYTKEKRQKKKIKSNQIKSTKLEPVDQRSHDQNSPSNLKAAVQLTASSDPHVFRHPRPHR